MFFNNTVATTELTDEMKAMILEEIENQQREAEHHHWLFVVGLARELFPGDNRAVDRVEEAIKNVLNNINGNTAEA